MWLREDNPPLRAYGIGGRQLRSDENQGNIYDHFAIVYEWADGTRTFAYTRQFSGCYNQTEDYVFGTKVVAGLCKHEIDGESPWRFEEPCVQMHQAEQNEFFKEIRGDRSRINNGTYLCRSTLTAILGREVAHSGQMLKSRRVPRICGPKAASGTPCRQQRKSLSPANTRFQRPDFNDFRPRVSPRGTKRFDLTVPLLR